jgi:FMN-dependent NADH-azoreductase
MQVLHIDSSITGAASVSRQLTAQTVAALVAANPGAKVEYLDLAVNAPDHLNAVSMGFRTGQAATTEAERAQNAISEALVTQFLAADVVVVGAPFYNFTISSQLKAWIDRIAQGGRTFRYTAAGPEGLHARRRLLHQRNGPGAGAPGKLPEDGVRFPGHHRCEHRARRRRGHGR